MAKVQLAVFNWGGPGQPASGVNSFVASLDRSPVVVEYTSSTTWPETWSKVGLITIRGAESGISGVIQEAPLWFLSNTLIYPRRSVLPSDSRRVRGYALFFEPFRWVTAGQIRVFWENTLDAPSVANWGGGQDA